MSFGRIGSARRPLSKRVRHCVTRFAGERRGWDRPLLSATGHQPTAPRVCPNLAPARAVTGCEVTPHARCHSALRAVVSPNPSGRVEHTWAVRLAGDEVHVAPAARATT